MRTNLIRAIVVALGPAIASGCGGAAPVGSNVEINPDVAAKQRAGIEQYTKLQKEALRNPQAKGSDATRNQRAAGKAP